MAGIKSVKVLMGGQVLLENCLVADSAWERMRGLLGRKGLAPGEGMWFTPCNSVHTFFMSFPIDVAMLSGKGQVVAVYRALKPWRHTWVHPGAASVLEAGAGALDRVKKGEVLTLCPSS